MKRGDETRRVLVQAWVQLSRKSRGLPTIKDLCRKAGVNRGTFYLHFDNMADLCRHEEERVVALLLSFPARVDPAAIAGPNAVAALEAAFVPLARYFTEHPDDAALLLLLDRGTAFRERFQAAISSNLRRLYGRRFTQDPHAPYLVTYVASAIHGVIIYWLNEGASLAPETLVALLARFNWQGPLKWEALTGRARSRARQRG